MRLLIVGGVGGTNVGDSFVHAAPACGAEVRIFDTAHASAGSRWLRAFCWRILDHRPVALTQFNTNLQSEIATFRPDVLLTTGIAPVTDVTLNAARAAGARCVNYLTDDPWNPAHRSTRFLRTIPLYDILFSTRRSNLADLRAAGAQRVEYLPFGFDPRFVAAGPAPAGNLVDQPEVLFVGGADADRVPVVAALIQSGLRVRLLGSYWNCYPQTRDHTGGQVGAVEVSQATEAAAIALILVRRANRDGHVMRSFEAAASRACLLVEDTVEHREIFGPDDECVVYFGNTESMIKAARELVANPERRARLASACSLRIRHGRHTYRDRLQTMLTRVSDLDAVEAGS